MKTILVATDFSERSDRAVGRAAHLARQSGARITLVHVVDDDQPGRIVAVERDEAQDLLDRLAARLAEDEGLDCATRVALASPFVGIADTVAEMAPDLLVLGPHRRQVLGDIFVGTTAERTIRSVRCPVLMANAVSQKPYGHILQTTDLSARSRDALRRFAALDLGATARTTLLHVYDTPALRLAMRHVLSQRDQAQYVEDEHDDALLHLAGFAAATGLAGIAQVARHNESVASKEILQAAASMQADLIVLSTNSRSGLSRMLIGSVSEQVLRASPVDVLVMPPRRRG
ncbi:MAG: universal stress protein [Rhodobacteraceae bacterium]|nr:MAG: universal stress protein [Paracoccaceae bacterium]